MAIGRAPLSRVGDGRDRADIVGDYKVRRLDATTIVADGAPGLWGTWIGVPCRPVAVLTGMIVTTNRVLPSGVMASCNQVADRAGRRENPRVIDRDEIEAMSEQLGVRTSDVQRDYLYGWLLASVYGDNPMMRDRLVLKGGNAFRKGYFVNTRFSGDLDFAAPAGLHPSQLLEALNGACRMIQARTGVEFDPRPKRQTGLPRS